MARSVGQLADLVVITSDNPRTEDPESIIDDIVQGLDGSASFVDEHTIRVEQDHAEINFHAHTIIIAVGSTPYRADRVPFNDVNIIDSDTMWEPGYTMSELPKSMLFVGAGVIGTEYACMFSTLGVDVRLLDRREYLFRFVDDEINDALLYHMRDGLNHALAEAQRAGAWGKKRQPSRLAFGSDSSTPSWRG